ncbi:MAG TPA: hypothetical protein DDW31_00635 [candidate division Zixibacteria bacterium]|nr:hypothetical protein [candidate division Zixibacteria bacterium]
MKMRIRTLALGCAAAALLCPGGQAQPKISEPLTARVNSAGPEERKAVMVYFTDKGLSGKESLASALEARSRQFSPRALKRRAKMGKAGMSYEDLAVSADYVEEIVNLGARHRQALNWFNAASFEMTKGQIEACAALGFVDRIEPLRSRGRKVPPEAPPPVPAPPEKDPGKSLLNYGPSLRQNLMINAVACHDSGLSGAGVLVAVFDNGFRKNHQAFDAIRASGRLVDEWDFCSSADTVDWAGHGTGTWSLAGGYVPGQLIGPAYGADWAIYHTEDNYQEMPIEEDHWAAALQRADSIGADVVSSSLAYRDFDDPNLSYVYQDLDGNTAISTLAAKHAAWLGIVVCNAMANSGPSIGSLAAPADADSILSVGATDSLGFLASYSSRGPTYDGRPKPEVCAQGSQTWWASWNTTSSYGRATGTSCATPLVAGACALLLEAHPEWAPKQVREALMMTASRAANPDSAHYGWGVIDAWAAMHYDQTGVASGGKAPLVPAGLKPRCRPNPARGRTVVSFELPRPGPARLAVYDASGRLVCRDKADRLPRGLNQFIWDGRDLSGNPAASGVYFFLVEGAGQAGAAKAALIR